MSNLQHDLIFLILGIFFWLSFLIKFKPKNEQADKLAKAIHRWNNAWASQDNSDIIPARTAMIKALEEYEKWKSEE